MRRLTAFFADKTNLEDAFEIRIYINYKEGIALTSCIFQIVKQDKSCMIYLCGSLNV